MWNFTSDHSFNADIHLGHRLAIFSSDPQTVIHPAIGSSTGQAEGETVNGDAIGAAAGLNGAPAVLASLVFVGRQIGQNTEAIRVSATESHMVLYTQLLTSLEEAERTRFMYQASALFRF